MLLGDRMAVSDQLEDAFARSGTMHILAVSGLHLGILYWFIVQLIGKWRRHFLFNWLFVLISLLILWAFALLSGAAASTQRAATMFSVMIIANAINKESNALNTLAISGLIILWVNPYQLFSVGFQLSFLALGGILYLQPWITSWRRFENRIIQYLWQLVSVSLAAQIAVLPLSAYYFHQLPVYFLMANIFLVPLSFAIVITGMVVFACSSIPALSLVTMEPLIILTKLAGLIVEAIAEIPGSSIQGLQLDVGALSLWYGILVSAILFLRTRARWALMTLLCLWLFISLKRICHQLKTNGSANIMVYQIPGHTTIDFVSGKYLWALADSDFTSDPKTTEFKVGHYRRYLGLEQQGHIQTDETNGNPSGMWMFGRKRLLLVKSPIGVGFNNNIKIKSDIVVVTENSLDHVQQIKSMVDFELLVIDGSNSRKNASKLQEQARELGLEVHNCWEQGFKNINL
jgi:competence protein ComEC